MIKNVIFVFLFSGLLSACGGGGGSTAESTVSTVGSTNSPAGIDAQLVSGLYDTSKKDSGGVVIDASYTYISPTGFISVYDDQADSLGTGNNCYTLSTEAPQINWQLNGKQLSLVSSGTYSVDTGTFGLLIFSYNETEGLNTFSLSGGIAGGTGLFINDLRLGGSDGQKKIISPAIEDITSMMCP